MRNYAALPHEYMDEMADLTDEEWGRLTRALLRYSITGEETDLPGNERFFWRRVVNREQRYQKSFQEQDERRSEAARKAAQARWQRDDANACGGMQTNAVYAKPKTKDESETESDPNHKTVPRSTERRNGAARAASVERMKRDVAAMERLAKGGGGL